MSEPPKNSDPPAETTVRVNLRIAIYKGFTAGFLLLAFMGCLMEALIDFFRWLWPVGLLLSLATSMLVGLFMIFRNLRLQRDRLGLCLRCGYDLRASPDHCPECGTPVPHSQLTTRNSQLLTPPPTSHTPI